MWSGSGGAPWGNRGLRREGRHDGTTGRDSKCNVLGIAKCIPYKACSSLIIPISLAALTFGILPKMSAHGPPSERISAEEDRADKQATEFLDEVEGGQDAFKPSRTLEAPPLVRDLSPADRERLEKKLVRKIDFRLLPPVIIMYIMNYLDRVGTMHAEWMLKADSKQNNIATARLAGNPGLEEDLGLTDSQYETCVSILFVGYILMQIPSNLFLNKVGKPALYLPGVMVIWGLISLATALAKNFGGLLAIRFFLGFIEAAYFPGCLYFLSCWYNRKELAFRSAVLYSGSLISGAFAGLIAAGITNGMNGKAGLPAWKW